MITHLIVKWAAFVIVISLVHRAQTRVTTILCLSPNLIATAQRPKLCLSPIVPIEVPRLLLKLGIQANLVSCGDSACTQGLVVSRILERYSKKLVVSLR